MSQMCLLLTWHNLDILSTIWMIFSSTRQLLRFHDVFDLQALVLLVGFLDNQHARCDLDT